MRHVMAVALLRGAGLLGSGGSARRHGEPGATTPTRQSTMDTIAEQYVKLVLALGQHDADYVDAYYGPPEWKKAAEAPKVDLDGDRGEGG